MKKVLCLAVAISVAAVAEARVFGFGVKAGLDMPKVETNIAAATTNLSFGGFHAGIMGEFNIPIIGLGVQPELLYSNRQVAGMPNRSHMLEIPINISWGIGLPVLDTRVFGIVAPTFNYSFNKMKALSLDNEPSGISIPTFKQSSWGIALGLGVDFWKLQVMVKWKWAISDIMPSFPQDVKDAVGSTAETLPSKLKENTLTISLGYFIF